jgi:AraC-like DNA-binding protein
MRGKTVSRITFFKPRAELEPYIESFWILTSQTPLSANAPVITAPAGRSKLMIPFESPLLCTANGKTRQCHIQRINFVGTRDGPNFVRSGPQRTGLIGIEFAPYGAYTLFGIPMMETMNTIVDGDDLWGKWSRPVREELANTEGADRKMDFLQEQLSRILRKGDRRNRTVERCVGALKVTDGLVPVSRLEQETGFSRRYLDRLFKQHVGLSPKALAGIYRFQRFYRRWAGGEPYDLLRRDLYDRYFDQAHFIKEFKRMTGYSPREFCLGVTNDIGRQLTLQKACPGRSSREGIPEDPRTAFRRTPPSTLTFNPLARWSSSRAGHPGEDA